MIPAMTEAQMRNRFLESADDPMGSFRAPLNAVLREFRNEGFFGEMMHPLLFATAVTAALDAWIKEQLPMVQATFPLFRPKFCRALIKAIVPEADQTEVAEALDVQLAA